MQLRERINFLFAMSTSDRGMKKMSNVINSTTRWLVQTFTARAHTPFQQFLSTVRTYIIHFVEKHAVAAAIGGKSFQFPPH